jgi:hypothetical protein
MDKHVLQIDLSDQEGDGHGGFFGPTLPRQICLTSTLFRLLTHIFYATSFTVRVLLSERLELRMLRGWCAHHRKHLKFSH